MWEKKLNTSPILPKLQRVAANMRSGATVWRCPATWLVTLIFAFLVILSAQLHVHVAPRFTAKTQRISRATKIAVPYLGRARDPETPTGFLAS